MALLSMRVPHDTARLLSSLDVPGDKEDVAYMHVTLVYLGEDADMDAILRAIAATYRVTTRTKPFMLRANRISHFDGDGEKVPIICPIESDELHALQSELRREFDASGVDYSKKFPEYKPHCTLAYETAPLTENVDRPIDPSLQWGAHSVTLWAGRHGDEKLACEFSLTMGSSRDDKKTKTASAKAPNEAARNAVRVELFSERVRRFFLGR